MSAHTPGPWEVDQDASGTYFVGNNETIGWVCDIDQIAEDEWERGPVTMANARLVAAAPDLLAALQWIARVNAMDYEYQERARAAIAKATGEQA
jgi:hypothetical protein